MLVRFEQRRLLITPVVTEVVAMLYGESNRLADKMSQGKLHYNNPNSRFETKKSWQRRKPDYPEHVPLHPLERALMFVGSSIGSYFHPERNENIVALGESTAFRPMLRRLRDQMLADPVGRTILKERPRMTLTSLDLDYLRGLPSNTLGNTYIQWLNKEGVSPDTRVQVRYIDDEELAYVYQRYRECHDFYHAITGLPIIIEGEISVKLLEYLNIGIPMSGLGAAFAPLRLSKKQKKRLYGIYYPWAFRSGLYLKPLICVYWEKLLETDINELRQHLGIEAPPDLRQMRKKKNN